MWEEGFYTLAGLGSAWAACSNAGAGLEGAGQGLTLCTLKTFPGSTSYKVYSAPYKINMQGPR